MHWLFWWRPPALLRSVIVNRKDTSQEALQGLLWRSRGPWLVLRQVTALVAGQPPTPVDGDVLIHRDNVAFIQVLTD